MALLVDRLSPQLLILYQDHLRYTISLCHLLHPLSSQICFLVTLLPRLVSLCIPPTYSTCLLPPNVQCILRQPVVIF